MKKQTKISIIAIFMAMLVVMGCLNMLFVSAGNMYDRIDITDDGIKYAVSNDKVIILNYEGENNNLVIPEKIEDLSVVEIGLEGFWNCDLIESITIPNTVTSINDVAFNNCDNLQYVYIPSSVNYIGGKSFSGCCNLAEIVVSENNQAYRSIEGILYDKSTATIIKYPEGKKDEFFSIPNSVEKINGYAFENCISLKKLTIPSSVNTIEYGAFKGCLNLSEYDVNTSNSNFALIDGVLFSKDSTRLISYPCSKTDFLYSIPLGVKYIDGYAFENCSYIEKITLPESVIEIGVAAFNRCESLKSIYILNPNCEIYDLDNAISDTATIFGYIGSTAEEYAKKYQRKFVDINTEPTPDITEPNKTEIQNFEFTVLDNGTIEITDYIGSATELEVPSYIDGYAVTSIGDSAFFNCSNLVSIVIPDTVLYIGKDAFKSSENLMNITIPDSVISIGNSALLNTAWYNSQEDGVIYLDGFVCGYNGEISGEIIIKDGAKSICAGAFANCSDLIDIEFPDSLARIEAYAFYYCNNLTEVKIPDNVTSIGSGAFTGCSNLTTVKLPNKLDSLGESAFAYCEKLENISISETLTTLNMGTFYGCTALKSITIGKNITSIDYEALGYYYNGKGSSVKVDGFIIYGFDATAAEKYANENGFEFIALDSDNIEETTKPTQETESTTTPIEEFTSSTQATDKTGTDENKSLLGDVNGDGKLNIKDATVIQKYTAKMLELSDTQLTIADYNGDSKVNVKDATQIQKKIAGLI